MKYILIIILLVGCKYPSRVRVRVLENNTITYCDVKNYTYKAGDTLWIDLAKHIVDDTAQYTMKAVVEEKPR